MKNAVPCPRRRICPEIVFLSPWLKQDFPYFYARLTEVLHKHDVCFELLPHTRDYWCRDFMPFQVKDTPKLLLYRYAPDYLLRPRNLNQYLTDAVQVCDSLRLPYQQTNLVIDGGNMVQAGRYLIMTEKIFKENPNKKPQDIARELKRLTGLTLLLLPWDKAEKYGHADGIVHAIDKDQILMTNYEDFDPELAAEMERRLQKHFKVYHLHYRVSKPDKRNWVYINFLELDHLIILPALGIREDRQALRQIQQFFPYKKVINLRMDEIVAKGGAMNCISWTFPRKFYLDFHYAHQPALSPTATHV